jgi:hypothetical protein
MHTLPLKFLRLAFWGCWAITASFPFLMLIAFSGTDHITPSGFVYYVLGLVGLGITSIECFGDQPQLTRLGTWTSAVSFALVVLIGMSVGPVTY